MTYKRQFQSPDSPGPDLDFHHVFGSARDGYIELDTIPPAFSLRISKIFAALAETYSWLSPEQQELLCGTHLGIVDDRNGRIRLGSWVSWVNDTGL